LSIRFGIESPVSSLNENTTIPKAVIVFLYLAMRKKKDFVRFLSKEMNLLIFILLISINPL